MKQNKDNIRSAELLDAVKAIQRGLDEMKAWEGVPAIVALEQIRRKYSIPRDSRRTGVRRSV